MTRFDPLEWPLVDHPLAGTILVHGKPHQREYRSCPLNGRVYAITRPLPSRLFTDEGPKEQPSNDN